MSTALQQTLGSTSRSDNPSLLVTDANEDRWIGEGQEELLRALKACRVQGAFRGQGLSSLQERAVLVNLIAAAQDDARSWTQRLVDSVVGKFRAVGRVLGGVSTTPGDFQGTSLAPSTLGSSFASSAFAPSTSALSPTPPTLSLSRWFKGMAKSLVPRHYAASMALVGGLLLTPADKTAAKDLINNQGTYLARWRTNIASGAYVLGPPALSRSAQYGSSIWQVSHNVRLAEAIRDGFTEAKRILGSSNHCETCKREALRGWVAIGTVLPLGDAECQSQCHCRISFR